MTIRNFLDIDPPNQTQVAVFPIAYEQSTSYIKGTQNGPQAILNASSQVELYDSELDYDISKVGIQTQPVLTTNSLEDIQSKAMPLMEQGKFVVGLGGEHAVTIPLVTCASEVYGSIGLIQFDAHFDLRDSYQGSSVNHACVLRRCLPLVNNSLTLGIRSFSIEERDYANQEGILFLTDLDMHQPEFVFDEYLSQLPEMVYVTVDFDFFSPAEFPAVGTPVPGGFDWYNGIALLKQVFESKMVIGIDFVELCPKPGCIRSDFAAATLVYKSIGYWLKTRHYNV